MSLGAIYNRRRVAPRPRWQPLAGEAGEHLTTNKDMK